MRENLPALVMSVCLVGASPLSAQNSAAVQKPSASCESLLQHSMAWWLSSAPTSADRDKLTACMAGTKQVQTPSAPSVSTRSSTPMSAHDANAIAQLSLGMNSEEVEKRLGPPNRMEGERWSYDTESMGLLFIYFSAGRIKEVRPQLNAMTTDQQAWWSCREDRERATTPCRAVPKDMPAPRLRPAAAVRATDGLNRPSNWNSMSADDQATWLRLVPKTWAQMTDEDRKEWYRILARRSVELGASSSPATSPAWTPTTCMVESQALLLMSQNISQSMTYLQMTAGGPAAAPVKPSAPPSYRCDSSSYGSDTTTRCRPEAGGGDMYGYSPGILSQINAGRSADARWNALYEQVKTLQDEYIARRSAWEQHCSAANGR